MATDYLTSTGNWRPKIRTPTITLTPEYCNEQNEALIHRLSNSGEGEHDREAYAKTMEEVW